MTSCLNHRKKSCWQTYLIIVLVNKIKTGLNLKDLGEIWRERFALKVCV